MAGSLLRRRDVRLIVSAVGVSSAGDFLLWVPLTLHLRAMHGSGLVVAGLFLALWTPIVVLFRDRTLALVLSVAVVSLLFMSASITAEVFFVKDGLGASDLAFGLVFACWTTGMVVGAVAIARRVRDRARGTLTAIAVQAGGLALPTAVLSIPFGAVSWFFGGLGHGTKNVLARTLIQERVPARLHGRAFAAYNGLRNGAELIALVTGGVLVTTIGARTTLALAGAIPLVAALVGLALYRARDRESAPVAEAEAA